MENCSFLFNIYGIQTTIELSSHTNLVNFPGPPLPETLYCLDFTAMEISWGC